MLRYLKLIYVATTTLFSPATQTHVEHLLSQMNPLEKTELSIGHIIKKIEYDEKNPPIDAVFTDPLPFEWFPHICQKECAKNFFVIRSHVCQLLKAAEHNKFKEVFGLLMQYPQLCDFMDANGNTVLHTAVAHNHANLTLALLCHCPHLITHKNKQEKTPVHLVLERNPRKILLLIKGAYASK